MSALPALSPPAPARLHVAVPPAPRWVSRLLAQARVARPRLVEPLLDETLPLVVLTGPAGAGKSVLLAEWSVTDERPFVWVDLRTGDLAAAIARALPLPLPRPSATSLPVALEALGPAVVVLDGIHALAPASCELVAGLVEQLAVGTTIAVATRGAAPPELERIRAHLEVAELDADRLALTRTEAEALLAAAGATPAPGHRERILDLAAGWPAAVALAGRSLHEGGAAALAALSGDRFGDYVRDEALAGLHPSDRTFLRRTSVLDELTGPSCDAMLERDDSALVLRRLARSTGLLRPAAAAGAFERHPLVTRALRAELRVAEPGLAAALHRRAGDWAATEGDLRGAVEHALAARDPDRVGELLDERAASLAGSGDADLVLRWIGELPRDAITVRPSLALSAAVARLARGDRDAAEQWAAQAARHAGRDRTVEPRLAVLRAGVGRDPIDTAAGQALADLPEGSAWRPFALLLAGTAAWLAGRTDEALARLEEAARAAVLDAPLVRAACLAEVAIMAACAGDRQEAALHATQAHRALAGATDPDDPLAALPLAVSAMTLADSDRPDEARAAMGRAARALDQLPDAAPWYATATRVALARASLRLSDAGDARRLLGEASQLLRRAGDAPALHAWVDDAWSRCDDYAAGPVACPSALTIAELRVLRLLPSHLTFREIAARLHVSANTVKTQAHAVYRKLDACSRSEAVAHARAIGLVDA